MTRYRAHLVIVIDVDAGSIGAALEIARTRAEQLLPVSIETISVTKLGADQ